MVLLPMQVLVVVIILKVKIVPTLLLLMVLIEDLYLWVIYHKAIYNLVPLKMHKEEEEAQEEDIDEKIRMMWLILNHRK